MHKKFPACQRLDIHLPDERLIYFNENDSPREVLRRAVPESALTASINYNLMHPDNQEAQKTLYVNFCERKIY
ncbi:hypothetical protein PS15m_007445 [Mucor circinelloides]